MNLYIYILHRVIYILYRNSQRFKFDQNQFLENWTKSVGLTKSADWGLDPFLWWIFLSGKMGHQNLSEHGLGLGPLHHACLIMLRANGQHKAMAWSATWWQGRLKKIHTTWGFGILTLNSTCKDDTTMLTLYAHI